MSQTIAIVGSKECSNPSVVRAFVDALPAGTIVVTAGAKGVEEIVADQAKKRGLTVKAMQPDWPAEDAPRGALSKALTARNEKLVAAVDRVVGFVEGKSPSAEQVLSLAEKAGKVLAPTAPAVAHAQEAPAPSPADEVFGNKAAEAPAPAPAAGGKAEQVLVRGPKDEQANARLKELGGYWDGFNKGYRMQRSEGLEAFLAEHADFTAEPAPRRVRLVGDTREIQAQIKELGGKAHKETYRGQEGWVTEFPADKLEAVRALVAGRPGVTLLGEGEKKQDRILVYGNTYPVRDELTSLGGERVKREVNGKTQWSYRVPAEAAAALQDLLAKNPDIKTRGMEQFTPAASQGMER